MWRVSPKTKTKEYFRSEIFLMFCSLRLLNSSDILTWSRWEEEDDLQGEGECSQSSASCQGRHAAWTDRQQPGELGETDITAAGRELLLAKVISSLIWNRRDFSV